MNNTTVAATISTVNERMQPVPLCGADSLSSGEVSPSLATGGSRRGVAAAFPRSDSWLVSRRVPQAAQKRAGTRISAPHDGHLVTAPPSSPARPAAMLQALTHYLLGLRFTDTPRHAHTSSLKVSLHLAEQYNATILFLNTHGYRAPYGADWQFQRQSRRRTGRHDHIRADQFLLAIPHNYNPVLRRW